MTDQAEGPACLSWEAEVLCRAGLQLYAGQCLIICQK